LGIKVAYFSVTIKGKIDVIIGLWGELANTNPKFRWILKICGCPSDLRSFENFVSLSPI